MKTMLPAEAMKEMAKVAFEQATEMLARQAEQMASDPIMENVSGSDALLAFARAIRSTNGKMYPPSTPHA